MNIVLMGPPGSGKGTQGRRLAARLGTEHLSSGAILRAETDGGSAPGTRVAALVAAGTLVPDGLISAMVLPRAEAAAVRSGHVLDGCPRSATQAEALLTSRTPPDVGIALDVSEPALIARMPRRAQTEGRPDDTAEVITTRLRVFVESTRPVLDVFQNHGLLRTADADRTPSDIASTILDLLNRKAASS